MPTKKPLMHHLALLGTPDGRGNLDFNDKLTQREVDSMQLNAEKVGYPIPRLVKDPHGHTRAKCPACSQQCLIRGYTIHYAKVHDPYSKYNNGGKRLEPKIARAAERDTEKLSFDEVAWRERADESMRRILKKYS